MFIHMDALSRVTIKLVTVIGYLYSGIAGVHCEMTRAKVFLIGSITPRKMCTSKENFMVNISSG